MMMAVGMTTISLAWSTPTRAASEAEVVAGHLIELVKIGSVVVSEQQATINDAAKAEKGFTADFVADQIMERFKRQTKIDLRIPNVVPQANYYLALVEAERDVVDEAQPVINRQGVGFKGFLHAVFARRVGEHYYKKTGVQMKLTGINYRSLNSKPDDFEQEVLRMFSDPRHPKGQAYVRNTTIDGRSVLRMIDPEYAAASCLSCHGEPKGERDITGIKKEGWKEGELAGAVSLVLPLKQ
jgi:general secretion pathway protein A